MCFEGNSLELIYILNCKVKGWSVARMMKGTGLLHEIKLKNYLYFYESLKLFEIWRLI